MSQTQRLGKRGRFETGSEGRNKLLELTTKGGINMGLNAPKFGVWLIAVAVGVIGILLERGVHIPVLSEYARYSFWMVTGGFGLLALATLFRGL